MSLKDKSGRSERLLTYFAAAVLLCYFAVFALVNFAGFADYTTCDIYADTLVARLMWEEKSLFPSGFLFGNQFYVIATPVLSALFYGITGSMNISMALATTVMSVLILLCLDRLLRPFAESRLVRIAAMLMLVSAVFGKDIPSDEKGQLFFTLASFYACYLISFLFILGDYLRSRSDPALRPAALTLALFLAFCTGMQSLRQTCITMLPILCFEGLSALRALFKGETLRDIFKRPTLHRAVLYLVANLIGYFIVPVFGKVRHSIYSGQSVFNGASVSEKLRELLSAMETASGLDYVRALASPFFAIMFVFCLCVLAGGAYFVLRGLRSRQDGLSSAWWISVIAIVGTALASFVTSVTLRPIYLFIYYPLLVFSLAVLLVKASPKLRLPLVSLLCVLSLANIGFSYGKTIEKCLDDTKSDAELVSDYAVENGYELIYGSHSYTPPLICAHSDGKLIGVSWEDECIFRLSRYINVKYYNYKDDVHRALFAFLSTELDAALAETSANGTELTYLTTFGDYSLFTASQQLLYPPSETIDINGFYQ